MENDKSMRKLVIEIKGMECEGCVLNVTSRLKKIKDILNINVSLNEGFAYLDVNDKANLSKIEKEIREKINSAGYLVGEIREV
ncbi:heavy-metal-associated domain-containing protein [Saccharolobus shibatae]|uniref:HMA domain-containing protein n=1 Tax=Saccharolobus shibatae TaxID=2286 RepID=A0A8F5C193_9CREN|nr:heavy metal-associated domain-containing protein [Saccharolobus shibatae]QXJ35314.1 hypothetical protein J5U22_01861 [Saccharolobus shibatae]